MVDRLIHKTQERLRYIAQGISNEKQETSEADEAEKNEKLEENVSNNNG